MPHPFIIALHIISFKTVPRVKFLVTPTNGAFGHSKCGLQIRLVLLMWVMNGTLAGLINTFLRRLVLVG